MDKIIIYPSPSVEGGIDILTPCECGLTIEEIAQKDVPVGLPYMILDRSALPTDRTFRPAWQSDFSKPHGEAIGPNQWFINQYNAEIAAINAEPAPQAIMPAAFDAAEFPEEFTEEQKVAAYDELVAYVVEQNTQALEKFEASKAARIEQINKMIATQQAEMAA